MATRSVSGSGSLLPEERALEGDRLADPGGVVDAVDPDGVVVDEPAGLADDRRRDAVDVVDAVEPDGELGDRPEALGERVGRLGEPRVLHRDRDVVAEGAGEVGLVVRPLVVGPVVEDEEAEHLVAEDDRHEAHRADALGAVHPLEARDGPLEVAGEDRDVALADRGHADRLGVAREARDELEHRARQAALRGEVQRRRRIVVDPEPGAVRAEEGERGVDDLLEQPVEVLAAADLGDDPAQGGRAGRLIGARSPLGGAERTRPGRRTMGSGPRAGWAARLLSEDHPGSCSLR